MEITVDQLKQRIDNNDDLIIIDVREPYEYEEYNIGGELVPLGTLPEKINDLEKYKEKEVIIHCLTGVRSEMAQSFLLKAGFKDVKNLLGGIQAWRSKFDGGE